MAWAFVFAFFAGAMLPFQFGINAQLSHWLGDPIRASFVSFLVGTIALLVLSALVLKPLPSASRLSAAPWWVWTGGLLGAFYVAGTVVTAPRLGAVTLVVLIVAGQSVSSLLVDQFGWVGFPQHEISAGRIVGVVLLFTGVALVRIF